MRGSGIPLKRPRLMSHSPSPPLGSPPPRSRHYLSSWDLLPYDTVERISSLVPMETLRNLLLSFSTRAQSQVEKHLVEIMRARLRAIVRFVDAMHLADKSDLKFWRADWAAGGAARMEGAYLAVRVQLITEPALLSHFRLERNVTLSTLDNSMAATLARDMPDVLCLNIKTSSSSPPLTTLPSALSQCIQLRRLVLRRHAFREVPQCVLSLKGLHTLDVSDNPIEQLPDDIGMRLPNLRVFSIAGCPISRLPASLLEAMDRNFRQTWRFQRSRIPGLMISREEDGFLSNEYLDELLRTRFPALRARIVRRRGFLS